MSGRWPAATSAWIAPLCRARPQRSRRARGPAGRRRPGPWRGVYVANRTPRSDQQAPRRRAGVQGGHSGLPDGEEEDDQGYGRKDQRYSTPWDGGVICAGRRPPRVITYGAKQNVVLCTSGASKVNVVLAAASARRRCRHEHLGQLAQGGPEQDAGAARNRGRCSARASVSVNSALVVGFGNRQVVGTTRLGVGGRPDDGPEVVLEADHRHPLSPVAELRPQAGGPGQPHQLERAPAAVQDRGCPQDHDPYAGLCRDRVGASHCTQTWAAKSRPAEDSSVCGR